MLKRLFIGAVLFGCLTLATQEGHGYVRKGLYRLGFDSSVFRFGLVNLSFENAKDDSLRAFTVGAGMASTGLLLGVTVKNGLVLGARLNFGLSGQEELLSDEHYFSWGVSPFLEYVFLDRVVRPFLSVALGAQGASSYADDDSLWWGFRFGGGGGIHFFMHQSVSVDLALDVGYTLGKGRQFDADFQHWQLSTSVLLGTSGWF